MAQTIISSHLTTGMVSPSLASRTDWQPRANALLSARNVVIKPQGGCVRRPGLRRVVDITGAHSLFQWYRSEQEKYVVVAIQNGGYKLLGAGSEAVYDVDDESVEREQYNAYVFLATGVIGYFAPLSLDLLSIDSSSIIGRQYFGSLGDYRLGQGSGAAINGSGEAFVGAGGRLWGVDIGTGEFTDIGGFGDGIDITGLSFNSRDILYGVTLDGSLYTINTSDGSATQVFSGSLTNCRAVAINRTTNRLYRFHENNQGSGLVVISDLGGGQVQNATAGAWAIKSASFAGDKLYTISTHRTTEWMVGDNNIIVLRQKEPGLGSIAVGGLAINPVVSRVGSTDFDLLHTNIFNYADTGIITDRKRIKHIRRVDDSTDIEWLRYFDYYYASADGIKTNIAGASEPTLHNGATMADGVIDVGADVGGNSYAQLPSQVADKMRATDFAIVGAIITKASSSGSVGTIFADSQDEFSWYIKNNGEVKLWRSVVGTGEIAMPSGTIANGVAAGIGLYMQRDVAGGQVWFNNAVGGTATLGTAYIEAGDDLRIGSPGNTRQFDQTIANFFIVFPNDNFAALPADEKERVIADVGAWASTNDTTKTLRVTPQTRFVIEQAEITNPPLIRFADEDAWNAEVERIGEKFCAFGTGEGSNDMNGQGAFADENVDDKGERVYEWKNHGTSDVQDWRLVARAPNEDEIGKPKGYYAMAWNDTDGWPIDACVRHQRLVYAGTNKHPATLWASVIGNANSFLDEKAAFIPANIGDGNTDPLLPSEVRPDFATVRSLDTFNRIVHVLSDTALLVFTEGGEWALEGEINAEDVTKGYANQFSRFGSRPNVDVAAIDEMVFFASKSAAFSNYYDSNFRGYIPINITATRNEKIFTNIVRDDDGNEVEVANEVKKIVAAQPADLNGAFLVYFLMTDGTIKVWHTLHKQEFFAWATWDFVQTVGGDRRKLIIKDIIVVDDTVYVLSGNTIYELTTEQTTDAGTNFEIEIETPELVSPQFIGEAWVYPRKLLCVYLTFGALGEGCDCVIKFGDKDDTDSRDRTIRIDVAVPGIPIKERDCTQKGKGKRRIDCDIPTEAFLSNDDNLRAIIKCDNDTPFELRRIDSILEVNSIPVGGKGR